MIGRLFRVVAVLGALAVCVATAFLVYGALERGLSLGRLAPSADWDRPVSDAPTRVRFSVQRGQSAADVGAELERRGLIRSALAFRWEVESRGLGSRLQAGEYELSPSMSTREIIDILARGAVAEATRLTVVDGWRAEQVASRMEELGLGRADEILRIIRSPRAYGLTPPDPAASTLEGYLFPDTYNIDTSASAVQVIATMLEQFNRRFDDRLRQQATARGLTIAQAVTLASIVEREAAQPAERPLIASVYHNRLAAGMKLAADPTVQYALAEKDPRAAAGYGYWKPRLSRQDLEVDSPYNTYTINGLPPAPICNPGLASLEAAVQPADTPYLYFVARGDGTHAFASTSEEHLANVERYGSE